MDILAGQGLEKELPTTRLLPLLFANVPKEGQMDATLQTMVDVAGRAGLDLQEEGTRRFPQSLFLTGLC